MSKAIIQGWLEGLSLVELRFNRGGLDRLKAAIDLVEKDGKAKAEDDDQNVFYLVLNNELEERKKRRPSSGAFRLASMFLVYAVVTALSLLGLVQLYQWLTTQ